MKGFQNIEARFYPAYAWLWNTTVTKEGIKEQIDDMYSRGIRAFYVIGEPENFRPLSRKTALSPKYLSDEYLAMLRYAHDYATGKGMYTWLYNEGGYPSGMACGQVVELRPDLKRHLLVPDAVKLTADDIYNEAEDVIASFSNGVRVKTGFSSERDTEIEVYRQIVKNEALYYGESNFTDTGNPETVKLFMELTHERIKATFGDSLKNSPYMFDDEPSLYNWSRDFGEKFKAEYGYDITDYLNIIIGKKLPENDNERTSRIDYHEMCGKLFYNNYMLPMKEWLHQNNMLSIGHLNCDNTTDMFLYQGYGNLIKQLRGYDIPGIDVIWGQISYPDSKGKCCSEGYEFFPRVASSAAAHQGKNIALSESFAVYSEKLDFEEMRFVVGYQAVRGINLFNFMAISFDTDTPTAFQFRPNFNMKNPSRKSLLAINEYTARLSYIMQDGKPRTKTALYYPFRSLAAGDDVKIKVMEDFERIGHLLESQDISFDLIDEEFIASANVKDGVLVGEHKTYKNVFIPYSPYEKSEIKKKLSYLKSEYEKTENSDRIKTRIIDNKDKSYLLVFNENNKPINTAVKFKEQRKIYSIDLITGKVYIPEYKFKDGVYTVDISLTRGECAVLMFTDKNTDAEKAPEFNKIGELTKFEESPVFRYRLNACKGAYIENIELNFRQSKFSAWPKDFSGQYVYRTVADKDYGSGLVIDFGKVSVSAEFYLNGKRLSEAVMPPYRAALPYFNRGDELKIFVTSTTAAELVYSDYLDKVPDELQGSYSPELRELEKLAAPAGLFGPVSLFKHK